MILVMSPALTGVMVACFPPTIIIAILLGRSVGKYSRSAQDDLAKSNVLVEEVLQNIATVKAYANEALEQKRYGGYIEAFMGAAMKTARTRGKLIAFIIFGVFSAITVVLWYGTHLLISGALTKGELFGFALYTAFVGGALGSFADLYSNLRKSLGATERVREMLDEPKEQLTESKGQGAILQGEIRFDNVVFSYPSRPDVDVLKGMDFTIPAGQVVALVGSSGAGKSTIVSLLLRFYEPKSGRLLFDNIPSSDFSLNQVRSQVALVPQEVLLFGGSIAENIGYGKPGSSQAEIEEAAKLAFAHEFISQFPEGYKTLVGDRGIQLSGGQRQRVAIARALLKNPKILILDEATSALDAESEHFVQMALETLMRGRTCLIVAHRLSTIRKAHRILVLKQGQILESGTHDELMGDADGTYKRIVDLQTGGGLA
jgi:ATP-binding cassette subfamily B protein